MSGGDTTPIDLPVPEVAWFGTVRLSRRGKKILARVLRYPTGEAMLVALPDGGRSFAVEAQTVVRYEPGVPAPLMLHLLGLREKTMDSGGRGG